MKKESGHWTNIGIVKNEVERIKAEIGHFPAYRDLQKLSMSGLAAAIIRHHNGFRELRLIMGERMVREEMGYWKNWENVESSLKKIIDKLKRFPTQRDLYSLGETSLCYSIGEYHGGLNHARSKFGYDSIQRESGYWKNWENVESTLNKLSDKLGHFPSKTELGDLGFNGLISAIHRHYGGMRKIRERLGKPIGRNPKGYWPDLKNVLKETRLALEENELKELPSYSKLREMGYGALAKAINKYYGFEKFRTILGDSPKRVRLGSWKELPYIIERAIEALKKENWEELPSFAKLREAGYNSLASSINKYHGGFFTFKEMLYEHLGIKNSLNLLESLLERGERQ